jgi:chaperonin GroES
MKFKPLHDRVLIEVLDGSEKTAGGIIIPDTAQEKPQEGKVVAVGGGAKTEDGKKNSNGRQSWRQSFIWQMVRN